MNTGTCQRVQPLVLTRTDPQVSSGDAADTRTGDRRMRTVTPPCHRVGDFHGFWFSVRYDNLKRCRRSDMSSTIHMRTSEKAEQGVA
jgi:hypothetical protein